MNPIASKIIGACQPIIQLLQGLSYPLAFIGAACGVLLITIGQKRKGMEMIKWAAIGYLLMQFLPSLMVILMDVGQAMGK